ncbi:hypothetical protein AQ505_01920 [Pedobacter sp. PACM 27299]|uniref:MBG domain-containing protein n=1 Tax=Pedobacter sp. PACM 27299 TaxID=1727164 RepID=UPI0007058A67|nr:MBG domain-containing protein [Pedobacter sp. PACM 27299]ALL04362.1 hypothetical protein AQ505_01920 [Pedobacter sp. PACM 27299]
MKRITQNITVLMLFSLFCFFAKSSFAQTTLVPGDLAIIGVNNKGTSVNLAVVALRNIAANTVIKFTDKGWQGASLAFVTSVADGTIALTTGTINAGTVFTFTINGGPAPSVSVSPNIGSIAIDAGWTNLNIATAAGDSWLIYTGTEALPSFIYGLANWSTLNPGGSPPDQYGWARPDGIISASVSSLPDNLKLGNFQCNLAGANAKIYRAYSSTLIGSKASILANIVNIANWDFRTVVPAFELTPGTAGGAFSTAQPIFKLGSIPIDVTATPSTGTKVTGSTIAITVNFSDNVIVTGTPRIKLNSGASAYATYTSGNNSQDLIFTYTIAAGESSTDLDYSSVNALELNGGTLKDPQNEDADLTLPAPGATGSLGANAAIVVDAVNPTVSSVNTTIANGSYTTGKVLPVTVNFSEPVTVTGTPTLLLNTSSTPLNYLSGSGTSTITFEYTVLAAQSTAALNYVNTTALALNAGTIKDAAGNDATLTLPNPTIGLTGPLGKASIIIDTTSPTVSSVSGTSGTYNIASNVPISINFSEVINVTGSPLLALNVSPAGFASYVSGTGTSTLTFNYQVAGGQSSPDLDYTGTNALSLNGGTIKDAAGNNANITLASPGTVGSLGASSNIVLNGLRPTVLSIVREGGAAALTKNTSVNYTVTFSEAVSNVDITDFTLTSTGSLTAPIILIFNGSGTTYTLAVSTGPGNGTLRLNLRSAGTGIVSLATGNAISGGYTSGQTYTIDTTVPTIPALTIRSNNSNTALARTGDQVSLNIDASEALSLITVTMNGHPVTAVNQVSNSYTADYTVTSSDPEGPVTFTIDYSDLAGNVGSQVTATTNASKVVVDNLPTTITSVSTTATDGPHGVGTVLPLSLTFSEPVTVTGTPQLALNTGVGAVATYSGGSGTAVLNFNYTVLSGQSNPALDFTSTTALSLNGGTINDLNTSPALLTLPTPGAVGSLANGRSIVINGIAPTVLSIVRKTPVTELTNVNTVQYTVTFSEPVTGVDQLDFQISTGSTPLSSINAIEGSGAIYTVTVGTGSGNGTVAINLNSSGTGIANLVLNPILTGFGPSQSYTIDKVLPTITSASINSNHNGNGSIAIAGETITLNFSTSEQIGTPTVTISGNPATLANPSGNNWVATYTMLATDNDGQILFNITYADLAGNAGLPRTTTTNSSAVLYDKTPPTIPASLTFISNVSGQPAYAKVGSVVTLSFTSSEDLSNPLVTIAGIFVATTKVGSTYLATYTVPNLATNGVIPFTIDFEDVAGNLGIQVTNVSTGKNVTIDTTVPLISNVSIASNNPNPALAKPGDQVSLTFTASESVTATVLIDGLPATTLINNGNNVYTATKILSALNTEGVLTFNIVTIDLAGNQSLTVTNTNNASSVTFDKTLPIAPNFLGVTAGDQQNVMIWFLNSDYAKYELIGGNTGPLGNNVLTTVLAADATNPMTFTQTGLTNFQTYSYALRVYDAAGNQASSSTVTGIPLNSQTITFNQPEPAEYGSSFTITATSSSGLPVTLTSNEPALATISGNTVTVVGVNNLQSVSIIATQPGNASYTYAPAVIRVLQINRKPVTVTATAQAKTFGDLEPALTSPTISPALIGSDVSLGSLARVAGENAGTYEIQQNTFSLDQYKYAINYVPANFTINKKPLSVVPRAEYITLYNSPDPETLEYDISPVISGLPVTGALERVPGTAVGYYPFTLGTLSAGPNYALNLAPGGAVRITPLAISITPQPSSKQFGDPDPVINYSFNPALKIGDTFIGALGRSSGETPNNYPINIGTLAVNSNYTLSLAPGITNFTIQPKVINIVANAGQGKVYGDLDGIITYTSSPALLNGDSFSGAMGRTTGSAVGNYAIGIGSLAVSNPQNYTLQLAAENYAITKKTIQVAATAVSQVYGDADPASLPYTLSTPLANGDVFTGKLGRTAGTNVGSYPINLGDLTLSTTNYDLSFTPANLSITPKAIAITAVSNTKTYGDADPIFGYTSSSALINGDVFTGQLGRVAGENVGSYDLSLGDLVVSNNYTLAFNPGATLQIGKKDIAVLAEAKSKVYGDTDPELTYTSTPALINGDAFTGALSRAAGEDVNTYVIGKGDLALSANYNLNYTPANLTIGLKTINVTAIAKSKVYGDADPILDYNFTPALKTGDAFTGALSRAVGENVNTYVIGKGDLALSANYTLNYTPANLTIGLKTINVTAIAKSKVYGAADPALDYNFTPALKSGDAFTGALSRAAGENVNTYVIGKGDLALNSNYTLNYTPANFTIGSETIHVTAKAKTKIYGEADPAFDYNFTPALKIGDTFTGTLTRLTGDHVGNYAIGQGGLTLSSNYILAYTPANLSIAPKAISVQVDPIRKTYGTVDPPLTYTVNPVLESGDVFTGILSRSPGENKGNYVISKGTLAASTDYAVTLTEGPFLIDPAPLTVTADSQTKFVGTANPVFTGQFTGFVNGDNESVLTSKGTFTSVATISSPIGTYPIVPSGATGMNYQITNVNGVLTVKAGAPTNILLTAAALYENQIAGTKAGVLSSTADDPQATFTYSLATGSGDTDNAAFRISGDQLLTAASLDYETKKVYSVNVRSTTQHGFSLDKTFSINLSDVNEIPTLDVMASKTICYTTSTQTIDLTGISAGPESGQNTTITASGSNAALLQSLTVAPSSGGKALLSYRVKNGASGTSTITVTVKDDGGTNNGGVDTYSRTFVLTVNPLPVIAINANIGRNNNSSSTDVSKGETLVLTASGGSSYVWAVHNSIVSGQTSASLTVRPRETTTYTVTATNASGCSEQKSFTVNVLDDLVTIKATNILTPNGDGYNDKWIIENIDFYPNNEVKIFDKSGRMVYGKRSYDNSWDGMLNGMPLSEGTYYYVIDFGKDRQKFKGFITIVREN